MTQGLHVVSGTAAVPLLLVKLWTVYPRLFARMPRGRGRAARARGRRARRRSRVLVAASVFQLATGLANSAQWYPWSFSFRPTHYAVAWLAIGALLLHVAVKLPRRPARPGAPTSTTPRSTGPRPRSRAALSRRGLLRTTWLAAGVAVVATAGSTVPVLRRVSVLGVRSGDGPGGVPVNRTAAGAGVDEAATGASYRLTVVHGDRSVELSRADLEAMTQVTETLPIACVEGWSASGEWTGVRVRDLLALVGRRPESEVRVESLQTRYAFGTSTLPAQFAADARTLLALALSTGSRWRSTTATRAG